MYAANVRTCFVVFCKTGTLACKFDPTNSSRGPCTNRRITLNANRRFRQCRPPRSAELRMEYRNPFARCLRPLPSEGSALSPGYIICVSDVQSGWLACIHRSGAILMLRTASASRNKSADSSHSHRSARSKRRWTNSSAVKACSFDIVGAFARARTANPLSKSSTVSSNSFGCDALPNLTLLRRRPNAGVIAANHLATRVRSGGVGSC